jgi:hypothetical protein
VNADVQAFGNTGGVVMADNVIDGNLQCKSNNPLPAGGNKQSSSGEQGRSVRQLDARKCRADSSPGASSV